METVKCKHCKEEIKKDASVCKHCGKRNWLTLWTVFGVMLVIFIIYVLFSGWIQDIIYYNDRY